MNILLAYATNSSGTATASQVVEAALTSKGHTVTRKQISEVKPEELTQYQYVIFGSPSWLIDGQEGMPHDFFVNFIKQCEGKQFPGQKFAVFGLGDTSYEFFCGAVDHLTKFVTDHGGVIIAEPLRIDGYFYDQQHNDDLLKQWATALPIQ